MVFEVTETDQKKGKQTKARSAQAEAEIMPLFARAMIVGAASLPEKPNRILRDRAKIAILRTMAPDLGLPTPRDLVVSRTGYGKPLALGDGWNNVSVSFSYAPGQLWAALSLRAFGIGIDCASPSEFPARYPLRRAFTCGEVQFIEDGRSGGQATLAAFLWSAKEAAVKALGVGFHRIQPSSIGVTEPLCGAAQAFNYMPVPEEMRVQCGHDRLEIYSFRYEATWISVAAPDLPETPVRG